MEKEPPVHESPDIGPDGLFIVNEGSFGSGNASISYYNVETGGTEDNLFYRANGVPLGDVAQSMTIYGDRGWIVVNNSGVIFSVSLSDMTEKGRITGFASPRHIQFVSDSKAYVTDLYDTKILIVDPHSYRICGEVETGCSTEQMIISDGFMYVNSWSSGSEILKIDLSSDKIADRLEVGVQPCSMAMDRYGKLWVLTDGGGWEGNPAGYEKPALLAVDPVAFKVEREFVFDGFVPVSELVSDAEGDTLYWLGSGVWKMDVSSEVLPSAPFIAEDSGTAYYALSSSPYDGDIFVSDAIDYSQNGKVYRYSSDGHLKDEFPAGICPGAFCWYR